MEVGLLLLRLVTGLLLAGHGAQKLFGWFGGHGLHGTAGFVEPLGWRRGRRFAALLGLAELASVALALGLTGPGRYSLDHTLGWSLAGPRGGVVALGIGAAGWLAGAAARHRARGHGSGGQMPAEPAEPAGAGEFASAAEPVGVGAVAPPRPRHEVVVLLDDLDKAAAKALGYARTLRPLSVTALHVAVDPVHARGLAERWAHLGLDVPLESVSCPDRDLPGAVRQALTERMRPDTAVTVLIPQHHYGTLLDWALHDRTAQRLLHALDDLGDDQGAVHVTVMPYRVGPRRQRARATHRRRRVRAPGWATTGAA